MHLEGVLIEDRKGDTVLYAGDVKVRITDWFFFKKEADLKYIDDADIFLLAGGDVELGWRTFVTNGLNEHIPRRYFEGATLIGISAGAVQLGFCGLAEGGSLIETFQLVPFIIGAHEESDDWKTTRELLRLSPTNTKSIGLPTGGGAIYHEDQTLEPLRHPLVKLS